MREQMSRGFVDFLERFLLSHVPEKIIIEEQGTYGIKKLKRTKETRRKNASMVHGLRVFVFGKE